MIFFFSSKFIFIDVSSIVPSLKSYCYCKVKVQLSSSLPRDEKHIKLLDCVKRRNEKIVKALERKMYKERLRLFDVLSPEQRS